MLLTLSSVFGLFAMGTEFQDLSAELENHYGVRLSMTTDGNESNS
jgi:hypothetical protein